MNSGSNIILRLVLTGLCAWAAVAPGSLYGQDQGARFRVSTLAGGSPLQRDGIGSAAGFNEPSGIAIDRFGNLYVSDADRDSGFGNTIRKVTSDGVVTTLAGVQGPVGWRDGPGSSALFSVPEGLAIDQVGNIYVADSHNHAVRMISPDNMVSTLASGFTYAIGVAVDRVGNVFVGDTYNHVIRKITPQREIQIVAGSLRLAGSADGTGAEARFNYPQGVALDEAGNIFVADAENSTIRRVSPAGEVTTLAGASGVWGNADGRGGAARFARPSGLAVDRSGNIYVTDTGNHTLRKLGPEGTVTTVAGRAGQAGYADGTGDVARFSFPVGIAVGAAGAMYVADMGNNRVRVVAPAANPDAEVSNVSILASVGGEAPLIAEFTVAPGSPSTVLLRAVGPSLSAFGIANAVADPKLTLFDAKGVRLAENDQFTTTVANVFPVAGAFPLQSGGKDAALTATLPPGRYTARVDSAGTGSTLLEFYDAKGATPRIAKLSVQATSVSATEPVLTGITVRPGAGKQRLLLRAIGPTLATLGVPTADAASDPRIEVHGHGEKLAENDNWSDVPGEPYAFPFSLAQTFAQSGAFTLPWNSRDAALVHEFAEGSYTVVTRSSGNVPGKVMVEIAALPPLYLPQPARERREADLFLADFTVTVRKIGDRYEYVPSFRFMETERRGNISITNVEWMAEYEGREIRLEPWRINRSIPPAGTLVYPEAGPVFENHILSNDEFSRLSARIQSVDADVSFVWFEAVARIIRIE